MAAGALEPPAGVTPDFGSKSYYMRTMVIVLLPVTSTFIFMRVYHKTFVVKAHNWEDYTSLIAWLGLIAFSVCVIQGERFGSGVHQWNVSIDHYRLWAQWTNIVEMVYSPTISVTKLSILLMYLRLFMPHRIGTTYYLTQFVLWSQLAFYLIIFITTTCQCIPRRKIWEPFSPGRCVRADILLTVTAVYNILSDFSILLLPIGCIWRLQMPWRRKLAISTVFATGAVACVASVMRVVVGLGSYNNQDSTFTSAPSIHWTYAEIVIGIICGCMPAVPKFFRHLAPNIYSKLSIPRPAFLRRSPKSSPRKALISANEESHAPQRDIFQLRSFTAGPGLGTMVSDSFRNVLSFDQNDRENTGYQDIESSSTIRSVRLGSSMHQTIQPASNSSV